MIYDLVVIGSGLAAKSFLLRWALMVRDELTAQIPSVLVLSSAPNYPLCSLNSTATIARIGLQAGVGKLGDQLLKAYGEWEVIMSEFGSEVYTQAQHYQLLLDSKAQDSFTARYGEVTSMPAPLDHLKASVGQSYLVRPEALLSAMDECIQKYLPFTQQDELVLKVNPDGEVIGLGGRYQARQVVVAAGAAGEALLGDSFNSELSVPMGKLASGSYLEWQCPNPFKSLGSSWQLGIGKFNLIYRGLDGVLLLGGTNSGELSCFSALDMKAQYDLAQAQCLGQLPPFQQAQFKVGERSKLRMRMPFWGQVGASDSRVYAIRGLYKNGYTLAFLAGLELAQAGRAILGSNTRLQ